MKAIKQHVLMILWMIAGAVLVAASAVLIDWQPRPFDRRLAVAIAQSYDARVIRDAFGMPHIYGSRDSDVAFGLAYAHAEDDWRTIEEVILFSRGELARHRGRTAAVTDYLIAAMGANDAIRVKFDTAISIETKSILAGYAAGINLWCAEKRARCAHGVAPVTEQDVVAGFAARTPFFYGLEAELGALFTRNNSPASEIETSFNTYLRTEPGFATGSNAMAVAPHRSADGHTRLMVNSHQPFTGPVAWYEARLKSDEGWDMIGGLFPGSPLILHGANPDLGWAFTVNKPDLVDVFAMEVDDAKNPSRYKLDGAWRPFAVSKARFRVKLAGPFSLPVTRPVLRSVHGPAFVTANGVFAVSFAGDGEVRAIEQWRLMNKSRNFDQWRKAMEMQAIPSFNVVYADKEGTIAYFYNAAIPIRKPGRDWKKVQPGDRSDLVWAGVRPFGSAPQTLRPAAGYVINANNSPFESTAAESAPSSDNFPLEYGIDQEKTNRGIRLQELFGSDLSITPDEFIKYKFDDRYADSSALKKAIHTIIADKNIKDDAIMSEAISILKSWDGRADTENRSAALAISWGAKVFGRIYQENPSDLSSMRVALKETADELLKGFSRLDPTWGEVNRLRRGAFDLPVNGGPDTLRAIYTSGDLADGPLTASGGDSYILYADWDDRGVVSIRTVHQFGSATLDQKSPHYADQTPIFAAQQFRTPPLTLDALLETATSDYRLGKRDTR